MASVQQPRRNTRSSTRTEPVQDQNQNPTAAGSIPSTSRLPQAKSTMAGPSSKTAPSGNLDRQPRAQVASTSTSNTNISTGGGASTVAQRKAAMAAKLKANQENLVRGPGATGMDVGGGSKGSGSGPSGKTASGKSGNAEGGKGAKKQAPLQGTTNVAARGDRAALSEVTTGRQGASQQVQRTAAEPSTAATSSTAIQSRRPIRPLPSSSSGESIARAHQAVGKAIVHAHAKDVASGLGSSAVASSRPAVSRRPTRSSTVNAGAGSDGAENVKSAGGGKAVAVKEEGGSATEGSKTSAANRRSLKRTLTAVVSVKQEEPVVAKPMMQAAQDANIASTSRHVEPSPKRMRTSTPATFAGGDEDREATCEDELALKDEVKPKIKREQSDLKLGRVAETLMDVEEDEEGKGEYVIANDDDAVVHVGPGVEERIVMDHEMEMEGNWIDLDLDDDDDPTMASEYVKDIFVYMKELELTTMPNPDYMDSQKNLKWEMRGVLMDWIVEVHHKFRLLPETLFLATNLIDRFLSHRVVSVQKLQLVGLTCLFIAAKYEEVVCPSVTNFMHMADGGYEDEEILEAEKYVLTTLNFDLSYPNPMHFLRRVSKADGFDVDVRTVGKYFIEISCVDHKMLHVPPSLLAAAGIYLARLILAKGAWDGTLVHFATYTEKEILAPAQLMLDYILSKEVPHECFFKKYASKKYMKASTFVRDWAIAKFDRSDAEMEGSTRGSELATEVEQRALKTEEGADESAGEEEDEQ